MSLTIQLTYDHDDSVFIAKGECPPSKENPYSIGICCADKDYFEVLASIRSQAKEFAPEADLQVTVDSKAIDALLIQSSLNREV